MQQQIERALEDGQLDGIARSGCLFGSGQERFERRSALGSRASELHGGSAEEC
jgi:hypothetical protein